MTRRMNTRPRDERVDMHVEEELMVFEKARAIAAKPLRRRLDEIAFYPAHDVRQRSSACKSAHHKLVIKLDMPCRICGVRNSTLKHAKENPYGARAMETHHSVIEWAFANAIEASRFNTQLLPALRAQHPESAAYKKRAFSKREIAAWVDHSEDNLWVLCDVHHRAQYFGIHMVSYPVWEAQTLMRGNFEKTVRRVAAGA